MITDSYSKMVSENEMPATFGGGGDGGGGGDVILGADIEEEIELMLREQEKWVQESPDERENSISRSGSAPPIFDSATGGFGSGGGGGFGGGNMREHRSSCEEEMRADPAYLDYYYSNVNMNPRLPPPLRSKEDWRLGQRVAGHGSVGGIGDRRRGMWSGGNGGGDGDGSLFGMQSGFRGANEENAKGWRQESIEGMIQDDVSQSPGAFRPSPHVSLMYNGVARSSDSQFTHPYELASVDALQAGSSEHPDGASGQIKSTLLSNGSSTSHTYAASLSASISRSSTPDLQRGSRSPSPPLIMLFAPDMLMPEKAETRSAYSPIPG